MVVANERRTAVYEFGVQHPVGYVDSAAECECTPHSVCYSCAIGKSDPVDDPVGDLELSQTFASQYAPAKNDADDLYCKLGLAEFCKSAVARRMSGLI